MVVVTVMLPIFCLVHLSVCWSVGLSVRKVYCGKSTDWIRMLLGVVSEVGRGMGVLDGVGDRWRGRGHFGGWIWGIPL